MIIYKSKRALGSEYEERAIDFLKKQGYRILERNYQIRSGEIDIIAYQEGYLVFLEVKYRRDISKGYAQEAVDFRKQKKIMQTARHYLLVHGYGLDTACRFDVVAINGDDITLIRDAFQG